MGRFVTFAFAQGNKLRVNRPLLKRIITIKAIIFLSKDKEHKYVMDHPFSCAC